MRLRAGRRTTLLGYHLRPARGLELSRVKPVGEHPRGLNRLQPGVLDEMDPRGGRAENAVPVSLGGAWSEPGHGTRALAGKPIARRVSMADRPHEGGRLFRRRRDVRDERGDAGVFGEVQDFTDVGPHEMTG